MLSKKVMIEQLLSGIWNHFSDMKSFAWALRILTLTSTLAVECCPFLLPCGYASINTQIERVRELNEAVGNVIMITKYVLAETEFH